MIEELAELTRDGDLWSLRYERSFDVSVEELWTTLTDASRVAQWMLTEAMDLDPRVGGSVHYFWGGTSESKGTVSVFEPPRVLEYSWNEGAGTSMVRFELSELGVRTHVTLHHNRITTHDIRDIAAGWHTHLDILETVFTHDEIDFQSRFDELAPRYDEEMERT